VHLNKSDRASGRPNGYGVPLPQAWYPPFGAHFAPLRQIHSVNASQWRSWHFSIYLPINAHLRLSGKLDKSQRSMKPAAPPVPLPLWKILWKVLFFHTAPLPLSLLPSHCLSLSVVATWNEGFGFDCALFPHCALLKGRLNPKNINKLR